VLLGQIELGRPDLTDEQMSKIGLKVPSAQTALIAGASADVSWVDVI